MIKVLHVGMTPNYGGLESFIMNIYRNIDREKFQFEFLALHDKKIAYEDEIIELGGKVHHIIYTRKEIKHYSNKIKKFFSANKFDIVHQHRTNLFDIDVLWVAKFSGVKHRIVHSHSTGYIGNTNPLNKVAEFINKKFINIIATDLLACSDNAGQWMFDNNKFKIINNGINLETFSYNTDSRLKYRKEFLVKENQVLIGHVGSFLDVKNHKLLIDIMHELKDKYGDKYKLVLVGEGVLKKQIQKLVDEYELRENVLLLGKRTDIPEILSSLDIFVLPSKFEGFPISAVEAQSIGLPTLLSDVITRNVEIGQGVKFLDINNIDAWINEIVNCDKVKYDNKGVLIENKFDLSTLSNNMEECYLDMLKNSKIIK